MTCARYIWIWLSQSRGSHSRTGSLVNAKHPAANNANAAKSHNPQRRRTGFLSMLAFLQRLQGKNRGREIFCEVRTPEK